MWRLGVKNKHLLIAMTLQAVMQLACGDDADGDDDHDKSENTAGSGRAGRGGAGASGNAGAGGAPATDLTDLINMVTELATPMCDPEATSVTSCGDEQCPEITEQASMSCTINCCSPQNKCGQRSSDTRIQQFLGTGCASAPVPDARCPATTLLGMSYAGCCTDQGVCGQIIGTACFALGTVPCDATTTTDAGADAGI